MYAVTAIQTSWCYKTLYHQTIFTFQEQFQVKADNPLQSPLTGKFAERENVCFAAFRKQKYASGMNTVIVRFHARKYDSMSSYLLAKMFWSWWVPHVSVKHLGIGLCIEVLLVHVYNLRQPYFQIHFCQCVWVCAWVGVCVGVWVGVWVGGWVSG